MSLSLWTSAVFVVFPYASRILHIITEQSAKHANRISAKLRQLRQFGGVTKGCWTHDREVVDSTLSRVVIKWLQVTTRMGDCQLTAKLSSYII